MKIRNKLLYVSGGLYGQLGNVFAINHDKGWLLIDAGNPNSFEVIVENLKYWGIEKDEVTHVLLTHGHDDHAGTAREFQKLGAKVVAGQGDIEMLKDGNLGKDSPFTNHQMPALRPDININEDCDLIIGDLNFYVYTVPGYTNGSLLYYVNLDNDNILFTGDMFSCDGERGDLARPWWKGDLNYDASKLLQSFKKLWNLKLEPNIILGGHGNPRIGEDAKEMITVAYKEFLTNYR